MMNTKVKELQDQIDDLEDRIKHQKNKNRKETIIKNLKIFGNRCNFIAPFILTASLSFGASRIMQNNDLIIKQATANPTKYTTEYSNNKTPEKKDKELTKQTILFLISTIGIGTYINRKRNFDLTERLIEIRYEYDNNIQPITPLELELKYKKNLVLSLSKSNNTNKQY